MISGPFPVHFQHCDAAAPRGPCHDPPAIRSDWSMTGMMNRRELLASLAALGVVGIPTTATGQTRPLNILWRNAWAIVNIGDIGHVPGALALLRHHIPEATVTLWAQQELVFRDTIAQRARFPERTVDAAT